MADVAAVESNTPEVSATSTPKKGKAAKGAVKKTQAKKPSHPKTSEMVINAITELKERNGSSLQAIKKHIAATYKVDTDKLGIYIRKALKAAVESGQLTQKSGKGASGSFKIATGEKPSSGAAKKKPAPKKAKAKAAGGDAAPKKKAAAKKPAAAAAKKSVKAATKKAPAKAAKSSPKKAKAAPKEKKSTNKLPTAKKAKSPKVKKAPASKPKKATPKKK